MQIDFEKDAETIKENISKSDLGEIALLAKQQLQLEEKIAMLNDELKKAKDDLRVIQENDLPSAMDKYGLAKVMLETGETITIKSDVYLFIAKENKEKCFNFLRRKNLDHIIKNKFEIAFGKGEDTHAERLLKMLKKDKRLSELPFSLSSTIHPQTLKATIKEMIEKGVVFPKYFSVHYAKKSIIK